MLNTITDLGHAFTIWCSFNEVIPYLKTEDRKLFATERFAEFVAQQTYQDRSDFATRGVPEVDRSAILSAGLRAPGFLGHNLITLGTLLRYEQKLETKEYRAGLYQTQRMIEHDHRATEVAFDESTYDRSIHDVDLEHAVLDLLRGGVDDVHTATMADVSVEIWKHANDEQKKELLHFMSLLSQSRN